MRLVKDTGWMRPGDDFLTALLCGENCFIRVMQAEERPGVGRRAVGLVFDWEAEKKGEREREMRLELGLESNERSIGGVVSKS